MFGAERAFPWTSAAGVVQTHLMPSRADKLAACSPSALGRRSGSSMKIICRPAHSRCAAELVFADRLRRESATSRSDLGHPRQPRTVPGLGRSPAWLPVTIVVPSGNSAEKNAAMVALGATLIEYGADFEAAREEAHCRAEAEGLLFVPSFAPDLVKGVATYALELFQAVADLDAVYVPIGLGSGSAGRSWPATCWACLPSHRRAKHRRRLLCPVVRGRPAIAGNRSDT